MGNPLFDFVEKRKVIIQYFMRKMLSDSILDLGKCPNRQMHESESAFFPVGALCEAQNWIRKHFSRKVLYNYYLKKKLEPFSLYLTTSKNWFPIVLSNLARKGSFFFLLQARKLNFLPNGLYFPPKQPWGSPKFGFCHHHLQLSPSISREHKQGCFLNWIYVT